MAGDTSTLGRVGAAIRSARDGVARERVAPGQRRRGEDEGATHQRARVTWEVAEPSDALTWGVPLRGDAFVAAVAERGGFGPQRAVLEVGPGYGRLLTAALGQERPFRSWTGLDLSTANVAHLSGHFRDPRVSFREGDAESFSRAERFDTMVSSLVLKHLYPTFERALTNVAWHMAPEGLVFFDLVEARLVDRLLSAHAYFREETTYIRRYTGAEVGEIVGRCGLDLVALEHVEHAPGRRRLLVMARRPQVAGT